MLLLMSDLNAPVLGFHSIPFSFLTALPIPVCICWAPTFFKGRYHNLVSNLFRRRGRGREEEREGEGGKEEEAASTQSLADRSLHKWSRSTHTLHVRGTSGAQKYELYSLEVCGVAAPGHGTQQLVLNAWELNSTSDPLVKEPRKKVPTLNDGLHSWI